MMKRFLSAAAAGLLLAGSAHAAVVQPFGIGSRAAGMAEAIVADTDDSFSAYYNPAGIAKVDSPIINAGASVYFAEIEVKNITVGGATLPGADSEYTFDDMSPLVVPSLGYAMPISPRMGFGVAVYAPYGLHAKGDKDPHKYPTTRFSYEDLYKRVAVTPTLAWNLNERLRFGLGVSIGRSEMEAGRSYTANPFIAAPFLKAKNTVDNPAGVDPADLAKAQNVVNAFGPIFMAEAPGAIYDLRLETEDDLNISWNAGIQYDATDRLSFGLSYRSRTETDFEGDILFQAPGGAQQKVGTVKIDMDHPEQFQFGLRYEVTPKLAVSTDIVHTKWSVNERQQETLNFTTPVGVPDAPGPDPDAFRKAVLAGMNTLDGYDRDWKDEFQYKFGVEYVLNDMFTLRGGYAYDPTPVPESTFDTGWPDTNRHIFDLGAGITLSQNLSIDVALQHIRSTDWRKVDESKNLNHAIGDPLVILGMLPSNQVSLEDRGILWGGSVTVNYTF